MYGNPKKSFFLSIHSLSNRNSGILFLIVLFFLACFLHILAKINYMKFLFKKNYIYGNHSKFSLFALSKRSI